MSTGALPRLEAPPWLRHMLRPIAIPTDWTRVAVAAGGVGVPQVLGLLTGRVDAAVVASVGALCASFSDVTGSYRFRLRRLVIAAVLGAIGFAAGAAAPGPLWAMVAVLAVSVPSVLSSRLGELWASGGAHMLTFCVVATGQRSAVLPVPEQVGWFLAGELLVVALAAATWPLRGTAPARGAVADVFTAILRMLGPGDAVAARRHLTRALNTSHDVLIGGASMSRSRVRDRLHLVHLRATPVVEAAVSVAHAGLTPPPRTREALAELARCVRTGDTPPRFQPGEHDSALLAALDEGIAELVDALREAKRQQAPGAPRRRPSIGATTWLLALRMLLCLALAEGFGLVAGLDQTYWIALTVALVLRPNSGSVFARTVLRALGTILGVLVAWALLALLPAGWLLVPFIIALAGKLPVALSRHYGLFSAVVTALVLLQMSQQQQFYPAARLLDTFVGCAIVLVVGFALRGMRTGPSLRDGVADAVESVADYVSRSLAGAEHGRSALRRRTYRQLADLRSRLQQLLMNPTHHGEAEAWWPTIAVLERVVDAATERAVRAGEADLQQAQLLVSEMRTLNRRLRADPEVAPDALRADLDAIHRHLATE
ncbi:FUSC family protein [Saccharopolyspora sp. TS4A08]|uniref:FUSC family protein n=1 Tax=Saccharopolyspora ipomoeae TaxID=3042027 RepID=A0ABT6PWL7_9PSEU|nr:FUSC family protein [Saccharopolyspora sp. TS4A08]MDI2032397.1 FUSC family protein [Saccharopolyspora sp. TS4A08]